MAQIQRNDNGRLTADQNPVSTFAWAVRAVMLLPLQRLTAMSAPGLLLVIFACRVFVHSFTKDTTAAMCAEDTLVTT